MSITVIKDELLTQADWFIYMLRTRQDSIYTGITTDVCRRLRQHNGELKGGAKALRGKGPHVIEAAWQTDSRSSASQFEYYVKSLNKRQKHKLIADIDVMSPNGFTQKSNVMVQRIQLPKLPNPN